MTDAPNSDDPTPHARGLDPAAFVEKWAASGGAERANAQLFLADLAAVLGVPAPEATTGDLAGDAYVFERPLDFQDGTKSRGFIDLYKRGCFVLETKQGADAKRTADGRRLRQGHGKRGTRAWEATMEAARNQAEGYAKNLEAAEPPPPFLVVCDVGHCFDLYADFSGTGRLYRPFPDAGNNRLPLATLTDAGARTLLEAVWTDPLSLDPARRQARVTVALAKALAELAKELDGATDADGAPMDAEAVAGFLSRALFSMFAEDAGLIPEGAFTHLLENYADDLDDLPLALGSFFETMDRGGFVGEVRARLRRFNGSLFKDARAPRLSRGAYERLAEAARADWSDVEPSIFGTLLERALDPKERHRLGAHFTPRAYVERIVGPTILEPLREEWQGVRAAVETLAERAETAKTKGARTKARNEARAELAAFFSRLAGVRVLDPACGSGNFLYVTLAGLKALEDEARAAAVRLVGEAPGEGFGVTPQNLHGIEVNARAAAIADLVLWIGYLQWHRGRYGDAQPLPEPVLEGYGQVEHRDAVLASGDDGEPVPAAWPEADFIVGNPPFIGASRMREALGDEKTEALRATYPAVPESADLVMYWWERAAQAVREGRAERFGLITTNSVTQTFNRRVMERHLSPEAGDGAGPLALVFAVPDHPWVDGTDGAAVRVAMTVGAREADVDAKGGRLLKVIGETPSGDGYRELETHDLVGEINTDLSVGADVTQTEALVSNEGISHAGVKLYGLGFLVTPEQALKLGLGRVTGIERHVRPYLNGRDLMGHDRGLLVIDLFGLEPEEVRKSFPEVYEHLLREVKPDRDKSRERRVSENWWLHGRTREAMRIAVEGISRYIAVSEKSKHLALAFVDSTVLPDNRLIVFALEDAFHLGVMSSSVHIQWVLATGGTLEDRPVYVKTTCFEPFPFPARGPHDAEIRRLGEAIDAHRKDRQRQTGVGLTDLYNAVEALRTGRALTAKEAASAEAGLAHTLLDLHRRLDRAVLEAYGWADLDAEAPTFRAAVLNRLVALNRQRRAEERAGRVRYLRPEFQASGAEVQSGLGLVTPEAPEAEPARRPWPGSLPKQLAAVRQAVEAGADSPEAVRARFTGAPARGVAEALDALAELGLLQQMRSSIS